ncbi:hypothetical protein EVG20_g5251 [Dentipellis fragilis]|uniref:Uncharacterized protein n=1 Tax=Dentipellis fragilis TaxID=205917 RepID=A0A4Y9YVS6_9AGAM|nr:hypothetical protein EVG20_g5251 [Dentipellis fragilis]
MVPSSPTDDTPIWPLLKTVCASILEVFLICLSGYWLARIGVLEKKTQRPLGGLATRLLQLGKDTVHHSSLGVYGHHVDARGRAACAPHVQLNVINIALFTPCLLFSKVAFTLTPDKLKELWVIPLFFLAVTLVSMVVAWALGWLFRLKHSQRNFAMAASMFMNSNSLPIALLQALAKSVPGLEWGDDDSTDAMVGRALTYLTLCSTIGMVLRWSYGVSLLSQADPAEEVDTEPGHDEITPLLSDSEDTIINPIPVFIEPEIEPVAEAVQHLDRVESHADANMHLTHEEPRARIFYSFPNTPSSSRTNLSESSCEQTLDSGGESDHDDHEVLPQHRRSPTPPTSSRVHSLLRGTKHHTMHYVHRLMAFMTPPLWASLFSIIVALIRPLQHSLEVHLFPVKGAVGQLGNCSIPVTLVVLGAYFYPPPAEGEKEAGFVERARTRWRRVASQASLAASVREMFAKDEQVKSRMQKKKDHLRRGEGRTVFVSILARMVITPAVFIPIMVWGASTDIPNVFEDPVFILSLIILLSSPPALTLAQMTQAASGDAFERLISQTVFWSYCIVTAPATIVYAVLAMMIAKI